MQYTMYFLFPCPHLRKIIFCAIDDIKNVKIIRSHGNIQKDLPCRLITRRPCLPAFDAVPYLGKRVFHKNIMYFYVLNKNCNYHSG